MAQNPGKDEFLKKLRESRQATSQNQNSTATQTPTSVNESAAPKQENPLKKYLPKAQKSYPMPLVFDQAKNPEPVQTIQQPRPKVDKPFWEDAIDGISAGWKSMKGGVAQAVAEYADMAPSIFSTAPAMGMTTPATGFDKFGEKYREELQKQAKGESTPALPGVRDFAKREFAKADEVNKQADTESMGYFVGNMIPQAAGIATAIGVGAVNPAVGMLVGTASTGALGLMSGGMAAKEYDDYVAEKGLEVNPNDKLGSMLLSTAFEMGSEAIPVAKFVPKGFKGKMGKFIFGNTEVQAKKGAQLLEEFSNTNASRKQMVKNVTREIVEGAATEGPTEAVAELGNEFSSWLYKEKEDRATWQEMTKNALTAVAAGALMGGGLGPLSYGAQQYQNRQRREKAGKVVIAQDKTTGEALEIMGVANPDPKTPGMSQGTAIYQAIRPNGKVIEISENSVGAVVELPLSDFNELLKGKAKGEQILNQKKQSDAQEAAKQAQQEAANQFGQFSYTGADGIQMISQAKYNNDEVFVTSMLPDGSAVIMKQDGEKKVIKQSELIDLVNTPLDQFIQATTPTPPAPITPQNPIQKGEQVNIEGTNYVVTGYSLEDGLVQLENEEDGADFQQIPLEYFEQLRSPQAQEGDPLQEEQVDSTEGAATLRKLFPDQNETSPTGTITPESPSLPSQPAGEGQGGVGQPANENVPAKPGNQGVDNQVQVEEIEKRMKEAINSIIDNGGESDFYDAFEVQVGSKYFGGNTIKEVEDQINKYFDEQLAALNQPQSVIDDTQSNQVQVDPTVEQQFELNPAQNTQDIDFNINEVLGQYSGRAMGKAQVFRYLNELGEIGKQWAKEKGITSKEQLDQWTEKAHSKARSGKKAENKQAKEEFDQFKGEFNADQIEQIAAKAAQDFENLINQPANEVQQPQPPVKDGQQNVQDPKNQEDSPQEGKGQEGLVQGEGVLTPIRQLGTGANVYFETEKHRVNDYRGGKFMLNVGAEKDVIPAASIQFDSLEEAVRVADQVAKDYPKGVPAALQVDKYIDSIRKQGEPKKPKQALEATAISIDVNQVFTDEKRFQNRSELDKDKLKSISENFDLNQFDPLVIWKDPKNGKSMLLAGHHRLEGAKMAGAKQVPARYFEGTEQEAITYAKELSNANRTLEKPSDRAKIYRNDREKGMTKKAIQEKAKSLEGQNANRVIAYSYLNPGGDAFNDLTSFESSGESLSGDKIKTIAQWVGEARKTLPELTDSQENEIYKYLTQGGGKNITKLDDILTPVKRRLGKADFQPGQRLNLDNATSIGPAERALNQQIQELEGQVKDLRKQQKDAGPGQFVTIGNQIVQIEKKIADLKGQFDKAVKADANQFDLFGGVQNDLKNEGYTEKEIENGANGRQTIEPSTPAQRNQDSQKQEGGQGVQGKGDGGNPSANRKNNSSERTAGTNGNRADVGREQQNRDSANTGSQGKSEPKPTTGTGNNTGKPFLKLNSQGNFLKSFNSGRKLLNEAQLVELESKGKFLNQIIGDYPMLTLAHENELFDLVNSGLDKNYIGQLLSNKVNSIDFNASQPLNLTGVQENQESKPITKRGEIEAKIKAIQERSKALKDLQKSRPLTQMEKVELEAMTKEVDRLQRLWENSASKQNAVKPVQQEDLFGQNQPRPPKSDQLSAEAQKKADELKDLFNDFFDAGKNNLTSGGITPEQFTIAGKIIGKAGELGIVRFKQLIEWANQNIGTDKMRQYFNSFKAAYGANLMINNPEKEDINEIAASKFEDYLVVEKPKEELKPVSQPKPKQAELFEKPKSNQIDIFDSQSQENGKQRPGSDGQVRPTTGTSTKRPQTEATPENDNAENTPKLPSGKTGGNESGDGQAPGDGLRPDNSRGTGKPDSDGGNTGGGKSKQFGRPNSEGEQKVKREKKNQENFVIPEGFSYPDTYQKAARLDDNIRAMEIIVDAIENNKTKITDQEKEILFKYSGFGGLKDILNDPNGYYTRYDSEAMKQRYQKVYELINKIDPDGKRGVLETIKNSVLTAHFTEPEIIRAKYDLLQLTGFDGGYILEPSSGIGNYIGSLPKKLSDNSKLTGIEMEYFTSQIHALLYPGAKTLNSKLEDANIPEGSQDLVISNIPFNDFRVSDPAWVKNETPIRKQAKKTIHNYFMVKAIESTREGGLIAILASSAVMDTPGNQAIRRFMSEQTKFIGAVRLPNTAFKGASGTQVVTDIIFLQKRSAGEIIQDQPNFIETIQQKNQNNESNINEYFINNPSKVLGEIVFEGGQYDRNKGYTVNPLQTNKTLREQIFKALEAEMSAANYSVSKNSTAENKPEKISIDGVENLISGNIYNKGDNFYIVQKDFDGNTFGDPIKVDKKYISPVKDFIGVRNSLINLLEKEADNTITDQELKELRENLNKTYDNFAKKHGRLNEFKNIFIDDIQGFQTLSLEVLDDQGKFKGLADIFKKRTIGGDYVKPTKAETPTEAVMISKNEFGKINPKRMEELLGSDWMEISKDIIYTTPDGNLHYVDDYLSGNIIDKLEEARDQEGFERNVEALEKALPEPIPSQLIDIPIGARFVDASIYSQFVNEVVHPDSKIIYQEVNDTYKFSGYASDTKFGTIHTKAADIIEAAFADKNIVVNDWIDKKAVFNEQKTQAANEKVREFKEKWQAWISQKPDRLEQIAKVYNRLFNSTVTKNFTGEYLKFPGLKGVELRPHQKGAIARIIENNGGVIDHTVGAGKTLVMIASIMEMKRIGVAKKPLIIVKNDTVGQIFDSFRQAYPNAKVLSPSKNQFLTEKRKQFLNQIAMNDWDAVVLTQEQFKAIEPDPVFENSVISEEIELLEDAITDSKGSNLSRREQTSLEKRLANLRARLEENKGKIKKDREVPHFGRLGIDHIMVDESQDFKTLAYTTTHANVSGLGGQEGNQKTFDLLIKIRQIQALHKGDKGVTFLSGTPISNSMAELYLIFKYLIPSQLDRLQMKTFDAWAKNFAEKSSELEISAAGKLREKERFRAFINVPDLVRIYTNMADIKTYEDIKEYVPRPEIKGGSVELVKIPQSKIQQQFYKKLLYYSENNRQGGGYVLGLKSVDNRDEDNNPIGLTINNLSVKATMDMRLLYPEAPYDPNGKLGKVTSNIAKSYEETKKHKGVNLIFLDEGMSSQDNLDFDTLAEIRRIFVEEHGIPAEQIAIVNTYSKERRKELWKKAKAGEVRILIGGTQNMGTGVNIQDRVVGIHHLDTPWKPSDFEQRNGRGLRFGNWVAPLYGGVEIKVYGVERSLDAAKYDIVSIKQWFIDQMRTNRFERGTIEESGGDEESGFSQSTIAAELSGNPLVKAKAKNDKLIQRLENSKKTYYSEIATYNKRIDYSLINIASSERVIEVSEKYKAIAEKELQPKYEKDEKTGKIKEIPVLYKVGKEVFEKPSEAGEKLLKTRPYSFIELNQHKRGNKTLEPSMGMNGINLFTYIDPEAQQKEKSLTAISYVIELTDENGKKLYPFTGILSDQSVYAARAIKSWFTENQNIIDRNNFYIKSYKKNIEEAKEGLEKNKVWTKQEEYDKAIQEKNRIAEEVAKDTAQAKLDKENNLEKDMDIFSPMNFDPDGINLNPEDDSDIRFMRQPSPTRLSSILNPARAQEMIQRPNMGGRTQKASQIAQKAAEFTKDWNNSPTVITLNNGKEALERYPELAANYSEEDMNNIPAIFIRNPQTEKPEVVLIASHSYLSEKNGVEKAILHEIIGHHGVREMLKQKAKGDKAKYISEYNKLMEQVFDAKSADPFMLDIVERYFGKPVSELTANEKIIAGDEYIAHIAQEGVQDKWIDRVVAKLRQILRQLGFNFAISDAEIRALLGNSMRIVRGPQGKPVVRPGVDQSNGPRMMISENSDIGNMQGQNQIFDENYQFDNENAEYFVRFSDHIYEDLKRGWSSWSFGSYGFEGTRRELDDFLSKSTDESPVFISGFDIYPDQISEFEFGELYPNYWVAIDNVNARGGLSSHALPNNLKTTKDALAEISARKGKYDGTGEGNVMRTEEAKVIYSKDNMHIIEVGQNKINKPKFESTNQTQTPAFKSWFGDSKVIDENGNPLVVYHGTASDFDSFKKDTLGKNFDQSILGFYFTSGAESNLKKNIPYGSTASEYAFNAQSKGYTELDGANVMPVYLSIKKPLIIKGDGWYSPTTAIDKQRNDIARQIQEGDYDGIIAENVDKEEYGTEKIFVAFSPTQIKSATGNQGTFDGNNPDIRFMKTGQFYAKKEVQQQKSKELFDELKKNGFTPSNPYTNESSFGTSTYINFIDESGVQRKFRISDHSVTNINRIMDEYHYSQNTNIKSLVESVKKDVQLSKERAEKLKKQWKEQADRYKRLDEFWETIKVNFEGLTFKRNDRTYQDLEQFSKPERSNILQRVIDPLKKAYSYEWTEQIKPNELPKKKPSYDFIENLYLQQNKIAETESISSDPDIRFMKVGATPQDFARVNQRNYQQAKLSWWQRNVTERFQDRMIRAKNLINRKTGGNVSDKADFYTKENLASGKTLEKARRFEKDLWNPLIKTAQQIKQVSGIESEDISNYLKAKHHSERKAYFYEKEGLDEAGMEAFLEGKRNQYAVDEDLQDKYTPNQWEDKIQAQWDKKLSKIDPKWPTGMTDEEAEQRISNFESKVAPDLAKKLRDQVKKINTFTTVERYKSGMITKDVYKDLLTRYKNYVPLTDWSGMETTNEKVYSLLMSAKGRTSEAGDPIPFMATAAQEAIMRGENNRVKQSVLEFVKENVSPGEYFIRNAYYVNTKMQDEFGNDIWMETMIKPTEQQFASGEAMKSFNPDVHRSVQQQGEVPGVLPVMVKGKKVFIEFRDVNYKDDKESKKGLISTIKNINQDRVPEGFNWLRKYTRWLSSMFTQYSPEFGIRNLIRDLGFGAFNMVVDNDFRTAAQTMKKMGKSMKTLSAFFNSGEYLKRADGNYLKEFMEEGAMTGYTDLKSAGEIFDQARKEIAKADKNNLWRAGGMQTLKPVQAGLHALETYNKTLENAMRFSYYKTLREQGLSKQQAAAKAKDLTVNFNRKGRHSSAMGAVFIFFNASVQGTERLMRSFSNPKTRKKAWGFAGTIMAAGLMQSALHGLFDDEDEDGKTFYEKIPDYVRRNNIIIPTGDGDFIKIPLPYGLNIFYSAGESLGRIITGKSEAGKEAIGMLSAMSNVFSPIGGIEFNSEQDGFEQLSQTLAPSITQPVLDLAFNRNFTGRPIYRENFTANQYKFPDSQMYFEGVNPYLKEATTFLNDLTGGNEVLPGKIDINPEWIEYGLEQYLGGPVQFGKNLITTAGNIAEGQQVFDDPYLRSVPFVRSFAQKTGTDFEARQNFYDNRDAAIAAKEAYEAMVERSLESDAEEFFKENEKLISLAEEYKGYDRIISQMNKTINELKKADPEAYDADIENLLNQRTQVMREYNKRFGEEKFANRQNPLKELLNIK